VNLANLDRRLRRLEENAQQGRYAWRKRDGTEASFTPVELFNAHMDLTQAQYHAANNPGEDPGPFYGALVALFDTSPEERERLGRRVEWVASWDYEIERLFNPPPEAVEMFARLRGGASLDDLGDFEGHLS